MAMAWKKNASDETCYTYSQKQIKMEVQDVSLEQVLKELHAQSGYYILYNKQDVQGVKNVSLKVNGASVDEVLKLCLRNTSLQYEIEDQTILISVKKVNNEPEKKESVVLKGVVKDSKGGVLPGVTVMIKGTSVGTATDMDGYSKTGYCYSDIFVCGNENEGSEMGWSIRT